MAALTKDRDSEAKYRGRSINVKLAAATTIFAGAGVAVNAAGFALPASDTAGLRTIGVAEEKGDNAAGAAGDVEIRVRKGVFEFNQGATPVAQAQVGRAVMWADDNSVTTAAVAVNDIIAGTLDSLDKETGLPWVSILDEAE
jgi:hypothetical protein